MKKWVLLCFLASPSWATYSGYTYQRTIIIDATKVGTHSATYADFPVLVSSNGVSFSTSSSGGRLLNTSGYDLIFSTNSDCSYRLYWDTETVNNTGSATLNAWVKVPSISSTTNTTLYLCYGNSGISTYQGRSSGTWDSNYKAVWHLGNGTVLSAKDSTVNVVHGTITGATVTPGKIGGGAKFASSEIDISALSVTAGSRTFSYWVNPTNHAGYVLDSGTGRFVLALGADGPAANSATYFDGAFKGVSPTGALADGATHYVTITLNTSGSVGLGYIDGQKTATTAAYTSTALGGATRIGAYTGGGGSYMTGWLDEFRISNSVRSDGWIKTEYNSQNSPSTFYALGSETTDTPAASPNAPFLGAEF